MNNSGMPVLATVSVMEISANNTVSAHRDHPKMNNSGMPVLATVSVMEIPANNTVSVHRDHPNTPINYEIKLHVRSQN